jgi:arabinan endo-1,5-alpha-L-arabinosidase
MSNATPTRWIRRGSGLWGLAAAVAVAIGATVISLQAAGAAAIDIGGTYQLVSRSSGKAIAVQGASTADSAPIVQSTVRSSATNQRWQFVAGTAGTYVIKAVHSGKVIDVAAKSTADGASVVQYGANGGSNQEFSVVDTSSGYVKLVNRNSGKVLDVTGRSTAEDALITQYTDNGGTNQQWQLVRVAGDPGPSPSPSGTTPSATPSTQPPTKSLTIPSTLGTHDPSRLINDNGSYYFYSTGRGIPGWYTTDGKTWKQTPQIFPNGIPASVKSAVPANDGYDVWAPDIIFNPNTRLFSLYYSVANWDNTTHSAIGLATSPTLNPNAANYKWTDRGLVTQQTTDTYQAIDPAPFFDASGNLWLAFGSGYAAHRDHAINIIALDRSTGLRTSDTSFYTPESCGCEASYVHYHAGYYYLFWNTGGCCTGASSTYTIHVARSKSVTGPYTENSSKFFASTGNIHGPGHIGILSENGKDYYTYHYYPSSGGSVLGLGTITWTADGWPTR